MKTRLLIGLALALSGCDKPLAVNLSNPDAAAGVGRYTIIHSPHVQSDTVLLDTVTGETWQQADITDLKDKPSEWIRMYRLDNQSELAALLAIHPSIAKTGKAGAK